MLKYHEDNNATKKSAPAAPRTLLNALLGTAALLFICSYFMDETTADPILDGSSSAAAPVPMGSRRLSIDISMPEDQNYETAFGKATDVGIQQVGLALDWRDIEVQPGVYSNPYLSTANEFYPKKNVALNLTLRPINNTHKSVPDDLKLVAFDNAQMILRFQKLLDYVFSQTDKLTFSSIVIGSEFDVYLRKPAAPQAMRVLSPSALTTLADTPQLPDISSSGTPWSQYGVFFNSISQYIKTRKPGVKVALEATYPGLVGASKEELKTLNQLSDLVGVSYYPLESDFSVKDPAVVAADFRTLASIYPNKTIYFYQLGYPSSTVLNSSEDKQAQFIEAVFNAWDTYATQIGMIDFTYLTDCSEQEIANEAKYYGLTQNNAFSEFLRTLGLRRYPNSGEDKPAYLALKQNSKARGW